MRLLAFEKDGSPALGLRRGDEFIDLSEAEPDLPSDMPSLLGAWEAVKDRLSTLLDNPPANAVRALDGIVYCPPVWNAGKIVCVGLNYEDHAANFISSGSVDLGWP